VFDTDAAAALDATARRRLDRFASAFERINAHDYIQFAVEPSDPDVTKRAEAQILRLIGTGTRREAIRSAIESFIEAAGIAYSNHLSLPQYLLLNDGVVDQPEDRRRFLRTLERAVAALILWDQLSESEQVTLAGPWGTLVDQAVEA
jgi:hypothetical protein